MDFVCTADEPLDSTVTASEHQYQAKQVNILTDYSFVIN